MANRVDYDDVKEILDTTLTNDQITKFISTANLIVNQHLASESSMTDDLLTEIELWLSAHFCCIRDQRAASEGVTPVNISYQYRLGLNFEVTLYGQQAVALDHTGILKSLSKGKKPCSFGSIGDDSPLSTVEKSEIPT